MGVEFAEPPPRSSSSTHFLPLNPQNMVSLLQSPGSENPSIEINYMPS
jgi:hypothetical protein